MCVELLETVSLSNVVLKRVLPASDGTGFSTPQTSDFLSGLLRVALVRWPRASGKGPLCGHQGLALAVAATRSFLTPADEEWMGGVGQHVGEPTAWLGF